VVCYGRVYYYPVWYHHVWCIQNLLSPQYQYLLTVEPISNPNTKINDPRTFRPFHLSSNLSIAIKISSLLYLSSLNMKKKFCSKSRHADDDGMGPIKINLGHSSCTLVMELNDLEKVDVDIEH
jgi:hypothetical protein